MPRYDLASSFVRVETGITWEDRKSSGGGSALRTNALTKLRTVSSKVLLALVVMAHLCVYARCERNNDDSNVARNTVFA